MEVFHSYQKQFTCSLPAAPFGSGTCIKCLIGLWFELESFGGKLLSHAKILSRTDVKGRREEEYAWQEEGTVEKMRTNQVFSKFNSVLIRPMRVISALMAALLHSGTDACIPSFWIYLFTFYLSPSFCSHAWICNQESLVEIPSLSLRSEIQWEAVTVSPNDALKMFNGGRSY